MRLQADGPGRHRARGARRSPGQACRSSATRATAIRRARESNDFLAREVQKRPDRYSGFAHLADAGSARRRRRARALHARAEILRRHDQRPHQRPISRPSLAASVLGARRGARCADLHSSDRSGRASPRRSKASTACAAPPGNGALRPARTRCGWFSAACSTAFRAPRSCSAISARRCRILLWRFDSRAKLYGVKLAKQPSDYIKQNIVVTTSGMCSAEPLNCAHRRARPRPRDVRRRLSVRIGARRPANFSITSPLADAAARGHRRSTMPIRYFGLPKP